VTTFGEALGMFRTEGVASLTHAALAVVATGGAEANVAIGLARLGVEVRWLGRVGDDSMGRRIVRELRAEGVDCVAITDHAAPTGVMLKERPRPGRTSVVFYRSASAGSRLLPEDLEVLDIPSSDLLHLTGIFPALSDHSARTTIAAARIAGEAGVPISFDVNHRSSLWDPSQARPVYRELASAASLVFGGREELEILVGSHSDDRSLAAAVADLGAAEVVVKLGAEGAGVLLDGEWTTRTAVPVDVVDTVGAGDAFVAGYLRERLNGSPAALALRTATVAGAAVCEFEGDWEGAIRLSEMDDSNSSRDPVSR
jgi:2-dehydro-3-deoxygluconokinase